MRNPISLIKKAISSIGESKRSAKWATTRKKHLKNQDWCMYCGGTKNLQVHHIQPFHLFPERELQPTNLITLCEEWTKDCHLKTGHLGNWKNYNPAIKKIANADGPGKPAVAYKL